ncbi:PadR family transcriptional regulator [Polymorphospora lycopeni]|uniref:PadR family transcriptional regulator n=1 Tax=Polymorphospora lycopeni TaxID=3140240 RepID=A0ABV5CWL6_9ACTN
MQITLTVLKVLTALLEDPLAERYGLDLMKETGLPSGTLYPILARLESAGWLKAEKEMPPPIGRPRRRYYRLTAEGTIQARLARAEALRELGEKKPSTAIPLRPQGQLA